ncbi:hypothetical protein [Paenibacillus sp. HJGM_3]|uniref:hypothetical protein n=1 Tax=Paenibacillus sp. HJGM_3 TaxID=3379816 RepID=UPI00385C1E74
MGPEEQFVMPDTTVYRFGNVSTGRDVTLIGDPEAAPAVTTETYGVRIHSTLTDASRTFEFEVPIAGWFAIKLGGMTAADGGTADIRIDGTHYGQYSFYSINGQYPRSDLFIRQLELAAGNHTIVLTVRAKGNAYGTGEGTAMYPVRLVLIDLEAVTSSKTRRTYITDAKMAAARQNVQQYDWAAALCNEVLMIADQYVALGYERLWHFIPSQYVPRSYNVNQLKGNLSPVSGDLKQYGNYPWKADPLNEPWKIVDPAQRL